MSRLAMTMFFNVVTRTQIRAWTAYIALSDFATSLPSEDLETCSLSVSREKRKQTCPDAKVRIIDSINVLPRTRENNYSAHWFKVRKKCSGDHVFETFSSLIRVRPTWARGHRKEMILELSNRNGNRKSGVSHVRVLIGYSRSVTQISTTR